MKIKELLLQCLFPPRCLICNKVAEIGHRICRECLNEKVFQDFDELCKICSKPERGCVCSSDGFSFERCLATFSYSYDTVAMIDCLKKEPHSPVIKDLAKAMVKVIIKKESNKNFDYVTYVPMDAQKESSRGHNQAKSLCEIIAQELTVSFLDPPIKKINSGLVQHELSKSKRKENAEISFCEDKNISVSGRILLVDDVATTLATLDICAKLLKQRGATEVICVTACTTDRREPELKNHKS